MHFKPVIKARTRARACTDGLLLPVKCGEGPGRTAAAKLTRAEKRILARVTLAKTNKEIAGDLGISPATVKRHLENLLRKLGLKNRVEVAIYGLLINGCASAMSSDCPLQIWRQEKQPASAKWAD